ncbi:hypothetical protein TNCV_2292461 [Trichonephila clavipes]|nr:hypothetical protein TNCV_2292461 [Trichonephila clavipes]
MCSGLELWWPEFPMTFQGSRTFEYRIFVNESGNNDLCALLRVKGGLPVGMNPLPAWLFVGSLIAKEPNMTWDPV